MLQWMGGSRRKVASSRKSILSRQKQYFEQRKRQDQIAGQENLPDAQNKYVRGHEKTRSLDIISLANLATVVQQDYSSTTDSSQLGSSTPTKSSSELPFHKVQASNGNRRKIDERKLQASGSKRTSENIDNKMSKQNGEAQKDIFSEVSILDLLGDDGPTSISDGRPVPEAHVAFSVEGLGKVGIRTPAHSPRLYRVLPSPPKAPRRAQSSAKHKLPQYNHERKMIPTMQGIRVGRDDSAMESVCNARGIQDDEFGARKSAVFTFSCMSPDVYENRKQNFHDAEEIFYTASQKEQPWNASFGILKENFLMEKNGAEKKNKPIRTGSCPPFSLDANKFNSLDNDDLSVPISPSSRTMFREDKRFDVSAHSVHYFKDLTLDKVLNPVSFDWERSSPDSTFNQPSWSLLGMENSQDNISLLSEESCSSAAGTPSSRDERIYNLESHSSKLKKSKIKHKTQNQKYSTKNYDVGGFEEFVHLENNIVGDGIYKNMRSQWNPKEDHFSEDYSENLELNCYPFCKEKHISSAKSNLGQTLEDDLFNSFPMPEQYPTTKFSKNHEPSNFIHETEILKQFHGPDVLQPGAFPWKSKDKFQCSPFGRDIHEDAYFPDISKHKNVCDDIDYEYRRTSENLNNRDSGEKNSLSSNGRTAGIADSKTRCSNSSEVKDEIQELFDGPATRDPSVNSEEAPKSMEEEVPSQLESCNDDEQNLFDSHAPVPSQVANKEGVNRNSVPEWKNVGSKGEGDASYVMLQSYAFQLLCVQKVLMEQSEENKRR